MQTHNREFDIVIWGATGFVGQLVAEHLTGEYTPAELTMSLGGRNESALAEISHRLSTDHKDWDDLPIVLGGATDKAGLDELSERTTVVWATVGPYTEYGAPLVAACINGGTDYCDLTCEVTYIREIIKECVAYLAALRPRTNTSKAINTAPNVVFRVAST